MTKKLGRENHNKGVNKASTNVEEVKKKISDLLREYIESGDTTEACQCIRELGVFFFHHEVVKWAVTLAMETPSSQPLIFKLLKEAADKVLIS